MIYKVIALACLVVLLVTFLPSCASNITAHVQSSSATGVNQESDATSGGFFSVTLPDSWNERAKVVVLENGADIIIDNQLIYRFRVVENIPGAREKVLNLFNDGYSYYCENGTHFFFYDRVSQIPDSLVPQASFNDIVHPCMETDVGIAEKGDDGYVYLSLKAEEYVNHWHGIAFTVPESIRSRCLIRSHSGILKNFIYLVWQEGNDSNVSEYELCRFLALPPDDPHTDLYGRTDSYPEVILYNDTLYGGINMWKDDIISRPGVYEEPYWSRLPKRVRAMFSTEEVQQIVDSFTILSNAPDSGN